MFKRFANVVAAVSFIFILSLAVHAQNEDETVTNLRTTLNKTMNKKALDLLVNANLDFAVLRSVNDCGALGKDVTAFTKYMNDRFKGVERPGGYKQDLIKDLDQVLEMEARIIAVYDNGVAIIPADTPKPELKRALESLKGLRDSVYRTFGTLNSSAATLITTPLVLERSDAVLKKIPYDKEKQAAGYRAALARMNRAIELSPRKTFYEKRSRIHTSLGNTTESTADMAKAATMTQ